MKSDEIETIYSRHYATGEKITHDRLARLGYRFTARFINIAGGYKLFELLPLKSDQPADVCFLSMKHNDRGVVILDPFYEHKAMLMGVNPGKDSNPGIAKQKIDPHPDESQWKKPGGTLPQQERNAAALDGRAGE